MHDQNSWVNQREIKKHLASLHQMPNRCKHMDSLKACTTICTQYEKPNLRCWGGKWQSQQQWMVWLYTGIFFVMSEQPEDKSYKCNTTGLPVFTLQSPHNQGGPNMRKKDLTFSFLAGLVSATDTGCHRHLRCQFSCLPDQNNFNKNTWQKRATDGTVW